MNPFVRWILLGAMAALGAADSPAADAPLAFTRFDDGFAGHFEDLILNRLTLAPQGDGFTGRLDYLREWTIAAKPGGGGLVGTARAGGEQREFRVKRNGEWLEATLGKDRLRLSRTVPVDPRLATFGEPRPDPARRWTIAVYLGGDNNLEENALADLAEMQRAIPAEGVEVLVLLDRAKGFDTSDGDWTDTRVFRLRPGAAKPELVKTLGEMNTGDAATLGGFLTGVFATYPAQHHAAILWNHGGGWGGIAQDDDAPDYEGGQCMLDLRDIRVALRTAILRSVHRRLDLVAFDACLMAQLEVGLQVSDSADFMVASEAEVPAGGFPYEAVLPLFGDAARAPRDVATGIVGVFGDSYAAQQDPSTTLSAIDLEHLAAVAGALDRLSAKLQPAVAQGWPAFCRALYYGESYEPRSKRRKPKHSPSLDLADLGDRLEQGLAPFPAAKELAELRAALDRVVLAKRNGDDRRQSRGLAVFAPRFAHQQSPGYVIAPLAAGNRWPALLNSVHAAATAGAQEPVRLEDVSVFATVRDGKPVVHPMDGDRIDYTVNGKGIIQVLQWDAVQDGDVWVVLRKTWAPDPLWMTRSKQGATDLSDLFMPKFTDGKTALSVELPGLRFVASNGDASANLTLDTSAPRFDAPFAARAKLRRAGRGAPLDVEVYFDRAWWRAEAIFELTEGASAAEPRRLAPQPDDEFSFLLETRTEDFTAGTIESAPLRWGRGLQLVPVADEPGAYRTYLDAETMDGRESFVWADYAVEENPQLAAWRESWRAWEPKLMNGTWRRELATGPDEWKELDARAHFGAAIPGAGNVFRVTEEFGPKGRRETAATTWILDTRGMPTLRVLTELEGGRTLCWYGPAALGEERGSPWIAMKVLPVGGVLWRWKYSVLETLALPE